MTASIPDHHVVVIGSGVGACAPVCVSNRRGSKTSSSSTGRRTWGYLAGQCIPGNRGGYPVGDLPVLLLP